jgi:predicted nuclease of restriction endonuclease-like RecB superfamily
MATNKKTAKLSETERAYIITLLASGLSTREVSKKAAEKGIQISYQCVAKYLHKVEPRIAAIVENKDDSPLKRGIALKEIRVQKLAEIEAIYYEELRRRLEKGCSVDAYEVREWRAMLKDVRDEVEGRVPATSVNVVGQVNNFSVLLDRVYRDDDGDVIDV